MLVNVKFYKIFLIGLFLLFSFNLSANEKTKIISQLKSLNSLEFTFNQIINDKTENVFFPIPNKALSLIIHFE